MCDDAHVGGGEGGGEGGGRSMILTLKGGSRCCLWDIRTWFSGEHLRDSL